MSPGGLVAPVQRLERDVHAPPRRAGGRRGVAVRGEQPLHRRRRLRHREQTPVEPVHGERPLRDAQQRGHATAVHERHRELSVREQRAHRGERLGELRRARRGEPRRVGRLFVPVSPAEAARGGFLRPGGRVFAPVRASDERERDFDGAATQRLAETLYVLARRGERAETRLQETRRKRARVRRRARRQRLSQRARRGVSVAGLGPELFVKRDDALVVVRNDDIACVSARGGRVRALRVREVAREERRDGAGALGRRALHERATQRRHDLRHRAVAHERGRDVLSL